MKPFALALVILGTLCFAAPASGQTTGLPSRKGVLPVQGIYTVPSGVLLYDVVRATGASTADKADASDETKVPGIGIVVQKPDATTAVVQYVGEVKGLSSLVPGAVYFLSEIAGQITAIAPTASGAVAQRIGIAKDSTTLMLTIDPTYVVL